MLDVWAEPPATMHGASNWRIQCHDSRAMSHIAGCCHRANSMACHTRATYHIAGCCYNSRATGYIAGCSHLSKSVSWSCHIAGCNNSIRHIENRLPYFFLFLMQVRLWRAAAFISSPIHLFVDFFVILYSSIILTLTGSTFLLALYMVCAQCCWFYFSKSAASDI